MLSKGREVTECPSSHQGATHWFGERQGEHRKVRLCLFPPAPEISWQEIESLYYDVENAPKNTLPPQSLTNHLPYSLPVPETLHSKGPNELVPGTLDPAAVISLPHLSGPHL